MLLVNSRTSSPYQKFLVTFPTSSYLLFLPIQHWLFEKVVAKYFLAMGLLARVVYILMVSLVVSLMLSVNSLPSISYQKFG